MAQEIINVGLTPNDGIGDPLRTAFQKCNSNFSTLFQIGGVTGIANGSSTVVIPVANSAIYLNVGGTGNILEVNELGIEITGNIDATGYLHAATASVVGTINSNTVTATSSVETGALIVTGNSSVNNLNSDGNLNLSGFGSVVGNVVSNSYFVGNGYYLTGITSAPANIYNRVEVNGPANTLIAASVNDTLYFTSSNNISLTSNTANATINWAVSQTPTFTGNVTVGNLLTAGLVSAAGNITGGNLIGNIIVANTFTGNITRIINGTSNVFIPSSNGNIAASVNGTANVLVVSGSGISIAGNVTSGNIITTGSAYVGGDFYVDGNLTYVNVSTFGVEDPIISLGRGPNNAPLTSNDNKDRGVSLYYYTSAEKIAFMGWDNDQNTMFIAENVAVSSDVTTITSYGSLAIGNVSAQTMAVSGNIIGQSLVQGVTLSAIANITGGNVNASGLSLTGNVLSVLNVTGNINGGNIRTVGVLTSTGNVTGGNLVTSGLATVTGNITGGNIITAGIMSSTGNGVHGNVSTAGVVTASGNITGANILTAGSVSSTGGLFTSGSLVVNSNNNAIAIANGGSNAVGNIGSSSNYFNTVFAQATSAQYADLAEYYQADIDYSPGTVLEFGGKNEVTVSSEGSRRIAGVVSTNPAYVMNAKLSGENVVPVALIGRIPCKVMGAVRKGDMLISAGNGFAKSIGVYEPKLGTVIGKSLENFNGLEGIVEIVVGRL